jgi:LmbE family N-acetylglucosaminyl deacetylase
MSENNLPERPHRLMVIAAHPDDPEFGCAGTVAKWAAQGTEVLYCLVTSGSAGTRDPAITPGELATLREQEQRAAARELGVIDVIFLRHHDGLVVNDLHLRRELAMVIRQHQPEMVMTIDPWRHYQLHPDHRAVGLAALDAIITARERLIFPEQLVDGIEPWRVKEALLFWTDTPDCWIDIGDTIERRIAALRKHQSQVGHRDDLEERIRAFTRQMGEKQGMAYAEAFKRLILT